MLARSIKRRSVEAPGVTESRVQTDGRQVGAWSPILGGLGGLGELRYLTRLLRGVCPGLSKCSPLRRGAQLVRRGRLGVPGISLRVRDAHVCEKLLERSAAEKRRLGTEALSKG